MRRQRGNAEDDTPEPVTDKTTDSLSLNVRGITTDHMREHARLEAAGIFNVPTNRIKVELHGIHVATRDRFPTDLSTYARPDVLGASAVCVLVPDDQMPSYDRL